MKIIDFEKIILRVNLVAVAIIFVLLIPSSGVVASWFPENENAFWILPILIVSVLSTLWFLIRLNLSALIKRGVFENRRLSPREQENSKTKTFWLVTFSVLTFVTEMFMIIGMAFCLSAFTRGDLLEKIWSNLP